ncbi:unnamed protein product, partial [Ectocarpus sp. 8 AP-2014]
VAWSDGVAGRVGHLLLRDPRPRHWALLGLPDYPDEKGPVEEQDGLISSRPHAGTPVAVSIIEREQARCAEQEGMSVAIHPEAEYMGHHDPSIPPRHRGYTTQQITPIYLHQAEVPPVGGCVVIAVHAVVVRPLTSHPYKAR